MPLIMTLLCTNHTTAELFALGVKVTMTPAGMFTDV